MFHGWKYLLGEDRDIISKGIEDGNVYGGPYHIEINWTNKCKAKCFFCNSREWRDNSSFSWKKLKALLDKTKKHSLRSIRLSGGGEPLIHENLSDLLQWIGQNNIFLENLNTNGIALNEQLILDLMKINVDVVKISLNYSNEKYYEVGMGIPGKIFFTVCDNIKKLNSARKNNSLFGTIEVQFFVYKQTINKIKQMYELGNELGADKITFSELFDIPRNNQITSRDYFEIIQQFRHILLYDYGKNKVKIIIPRLFKELQKTKLEIFQHYTKNKMPEDFQETDYSNRFCYIGWYSMTILADERVYPCCYLMGANSISHFDTIENKSISDIWYGDYFQLVRKEMRIFHLSKGKRTSLKYKLKTILPECHSHTHCPISTFMADDKFYIEVEKRLNKFKLNSV